MNIFIDIETIPQQPENEAKSDININIRAPSTMKKLETIADWHLGNGKYAGVKDKAIESEYRKTSFDGAKGEIISIAIGTSIDSIDVFYRELGGDESKLLNDAFSHIRSIFKNKGNPFFIGQYVAGFDLKFLFHRSIILGVNPLFTIPFQGRHNHDFYCTQQAWAGFKGIMSQSNLCKALGIEGKPTDIDGSKVWDFVKDGKVERVAEYNKDDVYKNILIFNKLTFAK